MLNAYVSGRYILIHSEKCFAGIFVGLVVLEAAQAVFAAKVPDIPTGSKIYIENKSQSDEAARFAVLLASKLAKDEGGRNYLMPGFPVVERREDAAYVLRIMVVFRQVGRGGDVNVLLNAWLLDANGKELWSKNDTCVTTTWTSSDKGCMRDLSNDLKSAQVNSDGKRAGWLGWKRH
jgi:hypothetical protein